MGKRIGGEKKVPLIFYPRETDTRGGREEEEEGSGRHVLHELSIGGGGGKTSSLKTRVAAVGP